VHTIGAQQAVTASPASAPVSVAYDALLDGMSCRQQRSGRMDCEFRAGAAVRFVISGVGQEDVSIAFVEADAKGEFVASMVPLHGCVVVKPTRTADATKAAGIPASDSVLTFAFVSPRSGKVYRNWATCLNATRGEPARAEVARPDAIAARANQARVDSIRRVHVADSTARADSVRRARAQKAPPARPPR
jgi:hypothetical protein